MGNHESAQQSNQAGPNTTRIQQSDLRARSGIGIARTAAILASTEASGQLQTTTNPVQQAPVQSQMSQQLQDITRLTNAIIRGQNEMQEVPTTLSTNPILGTGHNQTEPQSQNNDRSPQSSRDKRPRNNNISSSNNNDSDFFHSGSDRQSSQRSDDDKDGTSSSSSSGRRGIGDRGILQNRRKPTRQGPNAVQGKQPVQPALATNFFGETTTNPDPSHAHRARVTRQQNAAEPRGVGRRGRASRGRQVQGRAAKVRGKP